MVYPKKWTQTTHRHVCWLCANCHDLFHRLVGSKIELGNNNIAWVRGQMKKIFRSAGVSYLPAK